MFLCGLPFFITLSRGIRFASAQYRPRRTAKLLSYALYETIKLYKRAGFEVQTCLMDNEFEPLKPLMSDTCIINTTAKENTCGGGGLRDLSKLSKGSTDVLVQRCER